jgi:hypothetical protein
MFIQRWVNDQDQLQVVSLFLSIINNNYFYEIDNENGQY